MQARLTHKDEDPGVQAEVFSAKQAQENGVDCLLHGHGDQVALQLEGEAYATEYLKRLRAGTAGPDELATLTAFMHDGPMLVGFTKVIQKALKSEVLA